MMDYFDIPKLSEEVILKIKEKYGYNNEDEEFYSIRACSIGNTTTLFSFMCSLESFKFLAEGEENISILKKGEYKTIWSEIDKLALQKAVDIVKPTIKKTEVITSLEQLKKYMDDHNLTKTYLNEKEKNDKLRNIKDDTLIPVKFRFSTSGGDGITYMILDERVDPVIFNKLKKAGLYYADGYVYPFSPNWAMGYNEQNILKLKEVGIKLFE